MKKVTSALGIIFFFISISSTSQIIREKAAILQKPFPILSPNGNILNETTGSVYSEFGDLFFEKNGKQYWLANYTQVIGPTKEFYRLFELKLDSGYIKEVTQEMLGGYYDVEAPNPPYYYEDIDNDGIKDILVIDHGKEGDPDFRKWMTFNIYFKGTVNGFKKTEIIGLTDIKAYYHGHDIADFDNDGDGRKDISYIDASNGDELGAFNVSTMLGSRSTVKTVFIRQGNQFVEKDYYLFDPYAKSILPILLGRWK